MHKNKELTIAEVENWLVNNPHADWVARHDMIARLKELKENVNTIKTNKDECNN